MIIACDTETTGTDFFHGCRPFLVTMCDGEGNYYFEGQVNPYTREVFWSEETLAEVQEYLDEATTIVFHNTQFDMRALESIGIKIDHLWSKTEDTLLASHALCSGDEHGLKELAIKYLEYWNDDESELEQAVKSARLFASHKGYAIAKQGHPHFPAMKGGVKWWMQDLWLCPEECLRYALCDVERTWLLWDAFRHGLNSECLWPVYKMRKRLLKICYDITTNGYRLNIRNTKDYINSLKRKMDLIRKYLEKTLNTPYKFNCEKKAHLKALIHGKLNIPILFTTDKGHASTSKADLLYYYQNYKNKPLNALMKLRKLSTDLRYVESYLKWADDDGYIHSNLNVTGTRETRQSSTSPNQQNITEKLAALFQPPPGNIWLDVDFVNIELRLWAYSVNNEDLIKAFEEGRSVHLMIMQALYPQEYQQYITSPTKALRKLYRSVKGGTFALIYGATEKKADETYGYKGATAKVYKRFPGIQEFTQSLIADCERNRVELGRHAVITLGGYLLDVPANEPFKACNYYIQGSAGMITAKAMIAITENNRFIDSEAKIVTQVHDSIKPQIPIHPGLAKTVGAIIQTMETCATDIFGITPVDYKVIYHPDDKNNPHLQELLALDGAPF